jgi:hypothetical protein
VPLRSFRTTYLPQTFHDSIRDLEECFMLSKHNFHAPLRNLKYLYGKLWSVLEQLKRNRGLDNVRLAGYSVNNSNSAACRLPLPSNKLYCEDVELRFKSLVIKYPGVVPSLCATRVSFGRGFFRVHRSQHGLMLGPPLLLRIVSTNIQTWSANYLNLTCPPWHLATFSSSHYAQVRSDFPFKSKLA